jgi:hypothetical protein
MELQLKVVGILLILLALIHAVFPKYFNWPIELKGLSLINKEMMYVHLFFIGLMVLLMGLLCLTSSKELIETPLGNKLVLGMSVFWATRLIIQFFGYSSSLWKGKRFETAIHIVFSIIWLYLSILFFVIFWISNNA